MFTVYPYEDYVISFDELEWPLNKDMLQAE